MDKNNRFGANLRGFENFKIEITREKLPKLPKFRGLRANDKNK